MTTTTEEQIDQQLRHLPPRFDALRALLAAYAGTLKVVLNATELDFIPSTTIGGARRRVVLKVRTAAGRYA